MNGIRAIQTMFWGKQCDAFQAGQEKYKLFKNDPEFVAGLMLYWAEGSKTSVAALANSDADMIKFITNWFKKFFGLPTTSFSIHLHMHSGQNEREIKEYWSGITAIPLLNFQKSFIKPEGSGYRKNLLYKGTVKVSARGKGSTYLLYTIFGSIAQFLEDTTNKKARVESWLEKLQYA